MYRFFSAFVAGILAISEASVAYQPDQNVWTESDHQEVQYLISNPATEDLFKDPLFSSPLETPAGEPILDQNPFFLRGQTWQTEPASDSDDVISERLPDGLRIYLPGVGRSLTIPRAFDLIGMNDSYLLFADRASGVESPSQGFFYCSRAEMTALATKALPVPIYYFPLEGTAAVKRAIEIPELEAIAITFADHSAPLPIRLQDLDQVKDIEATNLQFSRAMASLRQVDPENPDTVIHLASIDDDSVLPLPGSTAGFGIAFTGDFSFAPHQIGFIPWVLGLETAQATLSPEYLNLLHSTAWFGVKLGVIAIASTVARYTALKKLVDTKLKKNLGLSEWKAQLTVFTQALVFVAQVPTVWTGKNLMLAMDLAGVSPNSRLRKVYNWSFGYLLARSKKTPVDYKSFLTGVGILASLDQICYGLQLWVTNPMLALGIARHLGKFFPKLADAATKAWGPRGIMTEFRPISWIGNGVGWTFSGASAVASTVQSLAAQKAQKQVAEEMREKGQDPNDPAQQEKFKALVEMQIRTELNKRGLPGDEVFLFDSFTVYYAIQKYLGYVSPVPGKEDNYVGVTRPGAIGGSLKEALEKAQQQNDAEAIQILSALNDDFHAFSELQSNPRLIFKKQALLDMARRFRRVREELTALTGIKEESPETTMSVLQRWGQHSSENGAKRAAALFKQSLSNRTGYNQEPTPAKKTKLTNPLSDRPQISWWQFWKYYSVIDAAYARYQLRRSLRKAREQFVRENGIDPAQIPPDNEALRQKWSEAVTKRLANAVGIFPDPQAQEFNNAVSKAAADAFNTNWNQAPALQDAVKSLPQEAKDQIVNVMRADQYVSTYIDMANNYELPNDEDSGKSALLPLKLGRFQRFRQRSWVRKSEAFTRAVRFVEALYSDTDFKRGLSSSVFRNVPEAGDIFSGNERTAKGFIYDSTAGYGVARFWNAALPPDKWIINEGLYASFVSGPWGTVQRISDFQGLKPGKDLKGIALYGFVGSWFTSLGPVAYSFIAPETVKHIDAAGAAITHAVRAGTETACHLILAHIGR